MSKPVEVPLKPEERQEFNDEVPKPRIRRVQSFGAILDLPSHRSYHPGLSHTKSLGVRVVWRTPHSADMDNLNRILRIPLRHRSPSPNKRSSSVTNIFSEHFDPLAVQVRQGVNSQNRSLSRIDYQDNLQVLAHARDRKLSRDHNLKDIKMPSVKSLALIFERIGKDDERQTLKSKRPRRYRTIAGGEISITKEKVFEPEANQETKVKNHLENETEHFRSNERTAKSNNESESDDKIKEVTITSEKTNKPLKLSISQTKKIADVEGSPLSPVKDLTLKFERSLSSPLDLDQYESSEVPSGEKLQHIRKIMVAKEVKKHVVNEKERSMTFLFLKKQWQDLVTASLTANKFKIQPKERVSKKPSESLTSQSMILSLNNDLENQQSTNVTKTLSPKILKNSPTETIRNISDEIQINISTEVLKNSPIKASINTATESYENIPTETCENISNETTRNISDETQTRISTEAPNIVNEHPNDMSTEANNNITDEDTYNIPNEALNIVTLKPDSAKLQHENNLLSEHFTRHASNKGFVKNVKQIFESKCLDSSMKDNKKYFSSPNVIEPSKSEEEFNGLSVIKSAKAIPHSLSAVSLNQPNVVAESTQESGIVSDTLHITGLTESSGFITVSDDLDIEDLPLMKRGPSVRDLAKQFESTNKNKTEFPERTFQKGEMAAIKKEKENAKEDISEKSTKTKIIDAAAYNSSVNFNQGALKNETIINIESKNIKIDLKINDAVDEQNTNFKRKVEIPDQSTIKEEKKNELQKNLKDSHEINDYKMEKEVVKCTDSNYLKSAKSLHDDDVINENQNESKLKKPKKIENEVALNNLIESSPASSVIIKVNDSINMNKDELQSFIQKPNENSEPIQTEEFLIVPKEDITSPPVNNILLEPQLKTADDDMDDSLGVFQRKIRSKSASAPKTAKTRQLKPDEVHFFQDLGASSIKGTVFRRDRSSSVASSTPASVGVDTTSVSRSNSIASKKFRDLHSDELKYFNAEVVTKTRSTSDVSLRKGVMNRAFEVRINESERRE